MSISVPKARLMDLWKARSRVFNTTFNPENIRTGNKILRERLKGPALANYYPKRVLTFRDLMKAFPEMQGYDDQEEERLEHITILKARGKGAPKKKRTAEDSKKYKGKKK